MSSTGGVGGIGGRSFNAPGASPDNPVATVREGETTLAQLASRLSVGLEALRQANPQLLDINALKPGQDIRLPQGPPAPANLLEQPADAGTQSTSISPPPLGDPLLKSMMQLKLDPGAAGPAIPLPGKNVMYADSAGGTGLSNATQTASPTVAPDISDVLTRGAKTKGAEKDFKTAQEAIAKGDYTKAYESLNTLLVKQGEDVLSENDVKSTQTIRDQLEFLSKMQKAGVKADFPPTEAQLVDYFKTLKAKPNEARQAFDDYTQNFHVHPVNIKGADFDVKYSQDKVQYGPNKSTYTVDVPHDWSSVANRPVSKDYPQYVGKQMNDCQGYAFMAEKLLGAAGFKVEHHIAVYPGPQGAGHSMVIFSHPGEKGYTVTSNDRSFHGANAKAAAQQGFEYAAGKENVTGKEHFWIGKNMAEAEIQQVVRDNEL